MKMMNRTFVFFICGVALLFPASTPSQVAWSSTSGMQRTTLNNLQTQGRMLQNAIQTIPNYRTGAPDILWQQFQGVVGAYVDLKRSLTPQQLYVGGNDLAELDAGLDIIGGAFVNYQNDLAAGRSPNLAMRTLCRVLNQGMGVWFRQLNMVSSRLQVGW